MGANEGKRWEWGGRERATEAEGLGGQDDTRKGGRLENQKEEGGGGRMKKQIIREGARKKIHRALPGKKNRKPRKLWGKSVQRKAEEKISKSGIPPPATNLPVLEPGDTRSLLIFFSIVKRGSKVGLVACFQHPKQSQLLF